MTTSAILFRDSNSVGLSNFKLFALAKKIYSLQQTEHCGRILIRLRQHRLRRLQQEIVARVIHHFFCHVRIANR